MSQNEFQHILEALSTLSPDEIRRLRDELDVKLASTGAGERPVLTPEEEAERDLQRRLVAAGLLSEIKPPHRFTAAGDDFIPVAIMGEPLSETIIRERR